MSMSNSSSSESFSREFSGLTRRIVPNINSYDGKITLVAVISLFVVITFVVLLHAYAKWFLGQARYRRRRPPVSITHVLNNPTLLHHHMRLSYDDSGFLADDGLDVSVIASIPLFVYQQSDEYYSCCDKNEHDELECAICLSAFEDGDIGRHLPKCCHAFHVECIDMWLHSHSSCPICRAPMKSEEKPTSTTMEVATLPNPEESNIELLATISAQSTIATSTAVEVSISAQSTIVTSTHPVEVSIEMPVPVPPPPPPPPPFSSIGLTGILSINRPENKVFPSSSETL